MKTPSEFGGNLGAGNAEPSRKVGVETERGGTLRGDATVRTARIT